MVAGDDRLAVEFHEGQLNRGRAGGDDDVGGGELLIADGDGVGGNEGRRAGDDGDLTCLGEGGDATG